MKKLLIVDDAPTILKMLKFTLSNAGYSVHTAGDASQAVEQIKSNGSFGVGIFDVNMPGKSGIELTRDVLAMEEGVNMKILILTTEFSDKLKTQGKEAGAKAWLVKPFLDDELVQIVNMLSSN